ncbi:MAG: hypothetical protein GMKNLPBB_03085 [Myxococcota bacterium]|nr:hypothetical protein [Myxococcota bacterium]
MSISGANHRSPADKKPKQRSDETVEGRDNYTLDVSHRSHIAKNPNHTTPLGTTAPNCKGRVGAFSRWNRVEHDEYCFSSGQWLLVFVVFCLTGSRKQPLRITQTVHQILGDANMIRQDVNRHPSPDPVIGATRMRENAINVLVDGQAPAWSVRSRRSTGPQHISGIRAGVSS